MEPFEIFEHAGVTIEIHQDTDAQDPFEVYDQLAELVWTDREYAWKTGAGGRVELDYEHYLDPDRFTSTAHAKRYLTLMERYLVAVPFKLNDYGSSGYQASILDEHADLDRVSGFLVVTEKRRELVGAPMEGLEANALNDWKEWKAWVQGDVYGYVLKAGTDTDSVWGFYGDLDYVRKEARAEAEGMAAERARLRALPWLPTFDNPILTGVTT